MTREDSAESGAIAVEFAFIVPLLMMVFFATVHFGLAVYRTQMVEAAAREGARVASVGADLDDIRARVIASAPGFAAQELTETGSISVRSRSSSTGDWSPDESGCQARGHDVRVVVTAAGPRLDFDIPFLPPFTPTYSAEAIFRCEAS